MPRLASLVPLVLNKKIIFIFHVKDLLSVKQGEKLKACIDLLTLVLEQYPLFMTVPAIPSWEVLPLPSPEGATLVYVSIM